MTFVKVTKSKAYFKRFQVKYRRRREGKTDYAARRKLTIQRKNKYNSPRYRLVVRFTNTKVICQIVYAEIVGDKVLAQAQSTELAQHGLKVGLKNYPAAYCTGLLVARRLLAKLGLGEKYEGMWGGDECEDTSVVLNKRKYYVDEIADGRRPFRANLDVGIKRTTNGAKVFAAMKGAADGGLDVPHSMKRFPGYDTDSKKYDPEEQRSFIFGARISEYMSEIQEADEENGTDRFSKMFSQYKAANVGPDDLEELYKAVHQSIRADPNKGVQSTSVKERRAAKGKNHGYDTKWQKTAKSTYEERKARVLAKRARLIAENAAEDESSEEEEESDDE